MKETPAIPADFQKSIHELLGDESDLFFKSLQSASPTSIRLNPKKESTADGRLIPWSQWGRYLNERPVFTLDPLWHAGAYYVQEPSSMFLEQALLHHLDLSKKVIALDLCASPGGKSTHLLSLLSEASLVVSNEVIRSRVSVLDENIKKWGYANSVITSSDPSHFGSLHQFFDLIVVDAPCSGEGLFRKDPGAIQQWSLENVKTCALRQQRILKEIWPALKPGGLLIYSTCTYNVHEDEDNMNWLSSQEDLEFLQVPVKPEWGVQEIIKERTLGYKFFPHRLEGEGFFISLVRKQSSDISANKRKKKSALSSASREDIKQLTPWLTTSSEIQFFKHKESILLIPAEVVDEVHSLVNHLHIISAGTLLATGKHGKMIPEHAAALSVVLDHKHFVNIDLDKDDAIKYLRKDSLTLDTSQRGFALVRYEGNALGWVNLLGNRMNNLYPSAWRIRM